MREKQDPNLSTESGQSIVLIALMFVILLLFVGLAVDAGLAFVRSSQFSRAVDAASLAGVVDLDPTSNDTAAADVRAGQFLGANGWPTPTLTLFESNRSFSGLGIPQYTLTATWPVNPFFVRLIGINAFPITHSATAAFYSQAGLFTPTAHDGGKMRRGTQFVFGPEACTQEGDPVSPLKTNPGQANEEQTIYEGIYRYRIAIPETYTETLLRVELFDTDSVNLRLGDTETISHTRAVSNSLGMTQSLNCTSLGDGDRCIIDTGENLDSDIQNPFWIRRVDETWNNSCAQDTGQATGDTVTQFELFYYDNLGQKQTVGVYTDNNGKSGQTDMNWVTPGITFPLLSPNSGSFQEDITGLPVDDEGFRYLHLDVTTTAGASKNGFDIWAGPIASFYTGQGYPALRADVNERNLQVANFPTIYRPDGIGVYALGRMPLNNFVSAEITMPLAPLELESGDGNLYASVFDYDISAPPPKMEFTIDTVSTNNFRMCGKVVASPNSSTTGECNVDELEASCNNSTDCNAAWTRPHYPMGIPGEDTGFFGGRLMVKYTPGGDAHTWSLSITSGRPFLTR